MTNTDTKATVLSVLGEVAPDADLDDFDHDAELRDELDIDSMDFLNLLMGVQEKLGVDVPEKDYAQVATLNALVAYIDSQR